MTGPLGTSFNVVLLPPEISGDMLAMQQMFAAYSKGPDLEFPSWWDFNRQVKLGHVVLGVVYINRVPVAYFGLELMTRPGPWINVLFYTGRINRPIMREMVLRLYSVLQMWKSELNRTDEVGSVRILGRSGWKRIAAGMGIEMDRRGFVFDNQKVIKDGYVRRFQ